MISEDCSFPTMHVHDGFIISHSVQLLDVEADETILRLTPKKKRKIVDPMNPGTFGGIVTPSFFMEGRLNLDEAKKPILSVMENSFKKFKEATGREYNLIETYNLDNSSKMAICTMGSMCGNIVSWMIKNPDVGLIKIRAYRPFPYKQLQKIVEDHGLEKLILLEKCDALNNLLPPFSMSVASALYPLGTLFHSFILGLGGRDPTSDEFDAAKSFGLTKLTKDSMKGQLYHYLGVRETKDKLYEV